MEYLMTYGWSILLISVALAALYELGVFNNFGGASACVAQSGFLCTNIFADANVLNSAGEPSINVTIGEVGSTWTNVYVISVPQGIILNNTTPGKVCNTCFYYWGEVVGTYGIMPQLTSGEEKQIRFWVKYTDPGVSGPYGELGERFTGTIWAMYSVPGATNTLAELGTYIVTATSNTLPN
jgi:hypothetical protein